jgi:hypothetical protein
MQRSRGVALTNPLFAVCALAAVMALANPRRAVAQWGSAVTGPSEPSLPEPHGRPRIEINPRPLLYRRCVDWYELQYRPSGTVLFPEKRCWWVRG